MSKQKLRRCLAEGCRAPTKYGHCDAHRPPMPEPEQTLEQTASARARVAELRADLESLKQYSEGLGVQPNFHGGAAHEPV